MWFEPVGCHGKIPEGAEGYSEEYDQTDIPHIWMSTEKACNPCMYIIKNALCFINALWFMNIHPPLWLSR